MEKPSVLLVHNFYQHPGGEDVVFSSEKSLLCEHGHNIYEYTRSNKQIEVLGRFNSAIQTIWSGPSYQEIIKILRRDKPDIAHFHNTFMLVSPSVYYACAQMGIPVIQTLHNYRLLCSNAYLFRKGTNCEDCIILKNPLPGVIHKCYRNSYSQSAIIAGMLGFHNLIRTWQNKIDYYIALTEFARQMFIQGGIPENKIIVKPNFVANIDESDRKGIGEYALYIGRLSNEKGIDTLMSTWETMQIPLKIVGDGPLRQYVQEHADHSSFIEYLGQVSRKSVIDLLIKSRFLVFPSKLFEGLPMTILEAFSCGVPVVSSDLGARSDIIRGSNSGLVYANRDSGDLATKVKWLWDHPIDCTKMAHNARREYEEKYTPEHNYEQLMDIYTRALAKKR
jgi:glycosyltransferase involved in cell wall biosynthesis